MADGNSIHSNSCVHLWLIKHVKVTCERGSASSCITQLCKRSENECGSQTCSEKKGLMPLPKWNGQIGLSNTILLDAARTGSLRGRLHLECVCIYDWSYMLKDEGSQRMTGESERD